MSPSVARAQRARRRRIAVALLLGVTPPAVATVAVSRRAARDTAA